jgi:uncharacterized protein YciI
MFVVVSTYLKSCAEVTPHLPAHADWLKKQHEQGIFIASGSLLPRSGGMILVQAISRPTLETILMEAPLAKAGAARYEIVEMQPDMLWG